MYVGLCVKNTDREELVSTVSEIVSRRLPDFKTNELTSYFVHCTQHFYGKGRNRPNENVKIVPHGDSVNAEISHIVVRNSDKATALRIKTVTDTLMNEVKCSNEFPHITAYTPHGVSPAESNKYVGLNNDEVTIIPYSKIISLRSIFF